MRSKNENRIEHHGETRTTKPRSQRYGKGIKIHEPNTFRGLMELLAVFTKVSWCIVGIRFGKMPSAIVNGCAAPLRCHSFRSEHVELVLHLGLVPYSWHV